MDPNTQYRDPPLKLDSQYLNWLQQARPAVSEEQFRSWIPHWKFSNDWSESMERALLLEPEPTNIRQALRWKRGEPRPPTYAKCLWVLTASLHRCKPTDIIPLDAMRVFNPNVIQAPDGRIYPDPFWPESFCCALFRLFGHPAWQYSYRLLTFVIGVAVICRTNFQWRWTNKYVGTDSFLYTFIELLSNNTGAETVDEILNRCLCNFVLEDWQASWWARLLCYMVMRTAGDRKAEDRELAKLNGTFAVPAQDHIFTGIWNVDEKDLELVEDAIWAADGG
ncbi:hypothetical protein B0H63DRAFT_509832 [Podospora didyma]|uniref:Uncharacterized protein n=1 Tax=Podospora didyma TaxID=330526 RepID=A0AAE0NNT5_9PEZI|nr:hypothetical protein B0H63DRAFT_509832 [Podospora didyma]